MLQGHMVGLHIPAVRLCALGFVHRQTPLYIIYLALIFPQMLLVLSYHQCPGVTLHYYYCHWMSAIFFPAALILACLDSHLRTAEAAFSTQKKMGGHPQHFPCAMDALYTLSLHAGSPSLK